MIRKNRNNYSKEFKQWLGEFFIQYHQQTGKKQRIKNMEKLYDSGLNAEAAATLSAEAQESKHE